MKSYTELEAERIANIIEREMGLSIGNIHTTSNKREIVLARQYAHAMIREKLPTMSLKDIGAIVGNKDHATCLHSCKTIKNLRETDKRYEERWNYLEGKVNPQKQKMTPIAYAEWILVSCAIIIDKNQHLRYEYEGNNYKADALYNIYLDSL